MRLHFFQSAETTPDICIWGYSLFVFTIHVIWMEFSEKNVTLHLEIRDGHRSTSDKPYLFAKLIKLRKSCMRGCSARCKQKSKV